MRTSPNTRAPDNGLSECYREAEPTLAVGHVDSGAACSVGPGQRQSLGRSKSHNRNRRPDELRAGLPCMNDWSGSIEDHSGGLQSVADTWTKVT